MLDVQERQIEERADAPHEPVALAVDRHERDHVKPALAVAFEQPFGRLGRRRHLAEHLPGARGQNANALDDLLTVLAVGFHAVLAQPQLGQDDPAAARFGAIADDLVVMHPDHVGPDAGRLLILARDHRASRSGARRGVDEDAREAIGQRLGEQRGGEGVKVDARQVYVVAPRPDIGRDVVAVGDRGRERLADHNRNGAAKRGKQGGDRNPRLEVVGMLQREPGHVLFARLAHGGGAGHQRLEHRPVLRQGLDGGRAVVNGSGHRSSSSASWALRSRAPGPAPVR